MVFIVALAQTHPHTPGMEQSFQWNSPSVSIKLIWLIMNLSAALTETWLHFLSLFLPLHRVSSFVGRRDKGEGGGQRKKVDGKRECFLLVLEYFPTVFSLIPLHNRFLGAVHSLLPFICVNNEYWWVPS